MTTAQPTSLRVSLPLHRPEPSFIIKFLADAFCPAALAPVTEMVCRGSKSATDFAPLALPTVTRAFSDPSSFGGVVRCGRTSGFGRGHVAK